MLPLFEERILKKMKRIALFLALIATLALATSCSDSKKIKPIGPIGAEKPAFTFSHEDTVEVRELVSQFIARMDDKDIRGAVEMLSFLEGDSICPLNPMQQRRQAMSLMNVRGVKYEMREMVLRSNTNNEVKMDITLFEKEEGDPKPNKTAMMFRPVKYEGKWYLTVWDNITETKSEDRLEK